jgi:ribonuclease HII
MQTLQQPNFSFEKRLWRQGLSVVAGVDEVGRGCFAGPVVAAAVAFAPMVNAKWQMPNGVHIDDSKKLTPRQRDRAEAWIRKNALTWGIGEANAVLINRIGMARASKVAFRKAIKAANSKFKVQNSKLDFLLIDAFFIPHVPSLPTRRRKDKKGRYRKNPKGRQAAIINGDEKSLSIAAASIIAKVYRDKLMTGLSKQKYRTEYDQHVAGKKYGWGKNKGYGTKEHQEAIKKYGITRLHRKQFVKNFI